MGLCVVGSGHRGRHRRPRTSKCVEANRIRLLSQVGVHVRACVHVCVLMHALARMLISLHLWAYKVSALVGGTRWAYSWAYKVSAFIRVEGWVQVFVHAGAGLHACGCVDEAAAAACAGAVWQARARSRSRSRWGGDLPEGKDFLQPSRHP